MCSSSSNDHRLMDTSEYGPLFFLAPSHSRSWLPKLSAWTKKTKNKQINGLTFIVSNKDISWTDI